MKRVDYHSRGFFLSDSMEDMYDPYRNKKSPLIREKVNFFENGGKCL